MAARVALACRYAVSGLAVAGLTAAVTDRVGATVMSALGTDAPITTGGSMGRTAFALVAGGCMSAVGILAGDSLLTMISPAEDDPLFRLFYYQAVFHSMGLANLSVTISRRLAGGLVGSVAPAPPAPTSSVTPQAPVAAAPTCSTGTCGSA
jgi:hypothetical protein